MIFSLTAPLAFIDRIQLQLPEGLVNWLTPVWILSLGAIAALVLGSVLWAIAYGLSRIPAIGGLSSNVQSKWTAVAVLGLIIFVAMFGINVMSASGPEIVPAAANRNADEAAEEKEQETALSKQITAASRYSLLIAISLLTAFTIVVLLGKKSVDETQAAIYEGALWPVLITTIVFAVFGVLGIFVVRKPSELLSSLARIPAMRTEGQVTQEFVLKAPATAIDDPVIEEKAVSFDRDEIRQLRFVADQRVKISSMPFVDGKGSGLTIDLKANEPAVWQKAPDAGNPFKTPKVDKLYVMNYGTKPANLKMTAISDVKFPEVRAVPITAIVLVSIFIIYLLQRAALPKLAAISLATAKSEIAQPIYVILMGLGIFLILVFVVIPYFTLGDDIKMLKDTGLSLILVLCIIQSVWAASSSVAEEIDGRTALTVLSKPVSRRDFILGKFVGIGWSTFLLAFALGIVFLISVAYKPIYDAREGAEYDPTWQRCYFEMVQTVPGLALAYLETLVMAALSVAISTRLPMLANFIICFAIYVLGHLTPLMVQSQVVAEQLPPVVFFGRLIATVLPVLDHFNIQASVASGVNVPLDYLGWALLYGMIYSTVAMLLALTLFEDRDLA
ncbi:hypothetical protein Psta_3204 [Pirellula staleyi DSM 6068]|uniref:ABC transporter permease n=1 Tax=Pirellula staleyi (strain ATCC 27377 / DSM 6068 / ICPB 4128) TaxID=530564 RepID=D2QWR5_PIRSD|nr:ABC transporter permease subunit [Pirellula staleyi]ADB17868.1 hypothetical protein Psta_3204 [Pirellula staleyi DSM 6068]